MTKLQTHLLVAVALVAGCSSEPDDRVEALEEAAENPRAVAGETIVVEGRVSRVLGDCAFELEGDGLLEVDDRVLTVCDPSPAGQPPPSVPAQVEEGDWLQVTGTAGEMTREEYEYKTALTLPEELFGETETRSVILVQSAKRIDRSSDADRAELPEAPLVVPIL